MERGTLSWKPTGRPILDTRTPSVVSASTVGDAGAEVAGATRPIGRPSDYTPELAELLCDKIAEGQPVLAICDDPGLPSRKTFYRWLEAHEDFRHKYARARAIQADALAEKALLRGLASTPETAQADRVALDALKWSAGKIAPKKYGDRAALELSDPNGNPIAGTTINALVLAPEAASRVREIARQALLGAGSDSGTDS